jgi:hypothetical protein
MDEAWAAADPVANAMADWAATMAAEAEDYRSVSCTKFSRVRFIQKCLLELKTS